MASIPFPSDPWGRVLVAAGVWTLLGAVPELVDPAAAYAQFHSGPVGEEALLLLRGSGGQTLLFAIGYLVAAYAQRRHALVVLLGGTGKAFYAVRLLLEVQAGEGGPLALVAAVGDLAFVTVFVIVLVRTRALADLATECRTTSRHPPRTLAR